jgi:rSAM/selenodomain-associated transferase 1
MKDTRRLIDFFKAPAKGSVKTRLAAEIGHSEALKAYEAMLKDLFENLSEHRNIIILYSDRLTEAPVRFRESFGLDTPSERGELTGIRQQRGADLGERMARSFEEVFQEGVERALLIGSDIPQIDGLLIREYFGRLETHPMVLGPSQDGGYHLIGFRRTDFSKAVFKGIDWGTDQVLSQTLERAKEKGFSVFRGKRLRDIDTMEDLTLVVRDARYEGKLRHLHVFCNRIGECPDQE